MKIIYEVIKMGIKQYMCILSEQFAYYKKVIKKAKIDMIKFYVPILSLIINVSTYFISRRSV